MNHIVIHMIFAQLKCRSNRNHHGVLLYNQIDINHKIITGIIHRFNINIKRNRQMKKHKNMIECFMEGL